MLGVGAGAGRKVAFLSGTNKAEGRCGGSGAMTGSGFSSAVCVCGAKSRTGGTGTSAVAVCASDSGILAVAACSSGSGLVNSATCGAAADDSASCDSANCC